MLNTNCILVINCEKHNVILADAKQNKIISCDCRVNINKIVHTFVLISINNKYKIKILINKQYENKIIDLNKIFVSVIGI